MCWGKVRLKGSRSSMFIACRGTARREKNKIDDKWKLSLEDVAYGRCLRMLLTLLDLVAVYTTNRLRFYVRTRVRGGLLEMLRGVPIQLSLTTHIQTLPWEFLCYSGEKAHQTIRSLGVIATRREIRTLKCHLHKGTALVTLGKGLLHPRLCQQQRMVTQPLGRTTP